VTAAELLRLWPKESIRVLAGCAPCQPFSTHRRGADTSSEAEWALIGEFGRLVQGTKPHIVTMENVANVAKSQVFRDFLGTLEARGFSVSYRLCYCPEYGLPQHRRRLVLIGSRIGMIPVPQGAYGPRDFRTVRDAISGLRPIQNGEADDQDPLHRTRTMTDINMKRIRASKPGGTWRDWPKELRAPCHQRETGSTFQSVYARMSWDKPSPTITAGFFNFGSGRYGHPSQDRAISLREGAILQGFPSTYQFVAPGEKIELAPLGRLIGNAVPPVLARFIGRAIVRQAHQRRILPGNLAVKGLPGAKRSG
jgi:DNA (cytosine-5)-methyltransferase 1